MAAAFDPFRQTLWIKSKGASKLRKRNRPLLHHVVDRVGAEGQQLTDFSGGEWRLAFLQRTNDRVHADLQ